MSVIIALLVFVISAILSYSVIRVYAVTADSMEMRFRTVESSMQRRTDTEEVLSKSFGNRFLVPLAQKFSAITGASPTTVTRYVEKKLLQAGGMAGLSAEQFIALTGMMVILLMVMSAGLAFLFKFDVAKMVSAIFYAAIAGLAFPFLMLSRKITARQASIQKDLPDVLDLVTVSVEAGLSFDGALAKLSEKMKGTLVDEFSRVLQEMRMGVTRRDALKAMSSRCDNKDLSLFISALVQADQLGVSIGGVLRVQAVAIRQNRKNQIEQKATKAPIQMLFPLVAFIFPTLFIVLLGPALLKIVTQL